MYTSSDVPLIRTAFIPWAPWHTPVEQAKIALVCTAGAYLKKGLHQPFGSDDPTFREFPSVVAMEDIALADGRYDQEDSRDDINVVFPLERLHTLAQAGYIGAVAPFAYSFASHTSDLIGLLADFAPSVAYRMKRMGTDLALLVAAGQEGHQIAALVARSIELAGVPTLIIGTDRHILEALKAPRAVVSGHPAGAPLGNPGNAGKHQHLIREALDAAWAFEGPGLVEALAFAPSRG